MTEPYVGQIVHYWNPDYEPDANFGVGVGPYAAIVTKVYAPWVSLAVLTHGKTELFHIASVPRRESTEDNGEYPAWSPAS